jgi:hypothetical protein
MVQRVLVLCLKPGSLSEDLRWNIMEFFKYTLKFFFNWELFKASGSQKPWSRTRSANFKNLGLENDQQTLKTWVQNLISKPQKHGSRNRSVDPKNRVLKPDQQTSETWVKNPISKLQNPGSRTPSANLQNLGPQNPISKQPVSSLMSPDPQRSREYVVSSVADPDPGSGAFLTLGSGMGKKTGSGPGTRPGMNKPCHISESL